MERIDYFKALREKVEQAGLELVVFGKAELAMIFKKDESKDTRYVIGSLTFNGEGLECSLSENHFGELMILIVSVDPTMKIAVAVPNE